MCLIRSSYITTIVQYIASLRSLLFLLTKYFLEKPYPTSKRSHPQFHIKTQSNQGKKNSKRNDSIHRYVSPPCCANTINVNYIHTVNVETWPAATTSGKLVKIPLCRKRRPRFHRRCPRVNTEGKTQLKAVKLYRREVRFERVGEEKEIKGE